MIATLAVLVVVTTRLAHPAAEPVRGEIVAQKLVANAEPLRIATRIPGSVTIDLADDADWTLALQAAGYWSPTHRIKRGDATPLEATLWPASRLHGTVDSVAERVTVRFRPVAPDGAPSGQVVCPVVEKQWSCVVPAGRFDLRIRPDDAITELRWDVALAANADAGVGVIRVRPGASLIGRIALADGVRADVRDVRVTLSPEFPAPAESDRERDRRAQLSVSTTPMARGYFHFDAVPAGRYVVLARGRGLTEARTNVVVLADREAELTSALVLDEPKTLSIVLAPPLAPDGRPWRVQLSRTAEGSSEEIATSAADADGRWRHEQLRDGDDVIMILAQNDVR